MSQLEAYLEMDSTDERIYKQQQLIRENEAREQAKRQQKEIAKLAKQRAMQGTSIDQMQSISSESVKKSADEQQEVSRAGMNQKLDSMQSNPTSNGQGSGGQAETQGVSSSASAMGSGMFGQDGAVTEQLGKARGEGGKRKAMQLGKAKKLPNNIELM